MHFAIYINEVMEERVGAHTHEQLEKLVFEHVYSDIQKLLKIFKLTPPT